MSRLHQSLGARWFEEVWNKGRREAIAELLAPDAPIHEGGVTVRGPGGFYPFFDRMQAAFSDLHVTVEDTFSADDKICIRWTCVMKHTGEGLGMAPTGKTLTTTGITIMRVAGEQIIEGWQNWDMLALLEQVREDGPAATYIAAT